MAICDVYKYTNPDLSGFFLWREGHLPPRGSTSAKTPSGFALALNGNICHGLESQRRISP